MNPSEPSRRETAADRPKGIGEGIAEALFQLVSRSSEEPARTDRESQFRRGMAKAPAFLERFGYPFDFRGKTVLDYGCGYGPLSFHLAQAEGAARVLGLDIDEEGLVFARDKLRGEFKSLAGVVDFAPATEPTEERFDFIVSKDSFQHYSDPEGTMQELIRMLAPGGLLIIGFGPLWKSPYGAPIEFMTKFPWAHLVFPESVVMRRRRLFRPAEAARSYADIRSGFTRMTLRRFQDIVARSGLRVVSVRTNASPGTTGRAFRAMAAIPGCREFFTLNAYCVLAFDAP